MTADVDAWPPGRLWELTGGNRMSSPDLRATRRAYEGHVRREMGDGAYESAYAEGLSMTYEEGLDYAVAE
ncbi:hypothetical protein [Streptomyces cavernae]|uniref:hypothetical protein n=1 Tax=Streptomyces cavernae TaxID=2259034 RepID=UPI000FEB724B|nr:hypothetical protein [Streptomyces cavernae]